MVRVYFPEIALTLVRRVTATLPFNHYLCVRLRAGDGKDVSTRARLRCPT